jgi:hypothetical protein
MSHWAEIDENNIVIRVTVGDNNDINGDEGYKWLIDNLGGSWIKTSYNGNIRKNFANKGYIYNVDLDAFIPPKPYNSWILNEDTCLWDSPIPMPIQEGKVFKWIEEDLNWQEIVLSQDEV